MTPCRILTSCLEVRRKRVLDVEDRAETVGCIGLR